ncbi:Peroxyureidoacrylate/ureidoacrylate amidohydrolase RutB [Gluconacetobacter sp. SXCC-1]|nr:Peroxyureidoacrylate/ureidoacrylate amidohydrolase RutB [Gluconacetobacter sp. SXCC-1]
MENATANHNEKEIIMSTAPQLPLPETGSMLDTGRTALLVIDVQNDFAAPAGAIGRAGVDMSAIAPALDNIHALIAAARSAGTPVIFARVITTPETDTRAQKLLARRTGQDPDSIAICRKDTWGAAYHQVQPERGEIEIQKRLYSCFYGTNLEDILKGRGIDTLVLTGFSTNCCVESTARDGFHRDFNIFIVKDACADYGMAAHEASLGALSGQCALPISTHDVLRAWT